jgi:hypothetical protein
MILILLKKIIKIKNSLISLFNANEFNGNYYYIFYIIILYKNYSSGESCNIL